MRTRVKLGEHRNVARAVVVLCLGITAALVVVSPAFAWSVNKSTNGIVIEREASDLASTTVSISRYWDYKGGENWDTAKNPASGTQYNSSEVLFASATIFEAFEVPYRPDYGRLQMITVAQTGQPGRLFMLVMEPMKVSLPANQSVAISTMPSVAVSIETSTGAALPVVINRWNPDDPLIYGVLAVVGLMGTVVGLKLGGQ